MWLIYLIGFVCIGCAIIWAIGRIKQIPIEIEEKQRIERLSQVVRDREGVTGSAG